METKYLGYRFSAVKITASCLGIWFADKRLWILQTKHLLHFVAFFHVASLFSTGVENKKLSFNQNVWRDHAIMQQDVLLHFWVILKSDWNMKKIFCCPALELFHCLPLRKTVLFVSSRAFLLSTPTFLFSTPVEESEATWKKKLQNATNYKTLVLAWCSVSSKSNI